MPADDLSLAIRIRADAQQAEAGESWIDGVRGALERLRDELLNGEIFYILKEAQVLIESCRHHYNAVRPHSSLGYRPPGSSCQAGRPAPLRSADHPAWLRNRQLH